MSSSIGDLVTHSVKHLLISVSGQLYNWHCRSLGRSQPTIRAWEASESDPRDFWPLRKLIRVIRRLDLTNWQRDRETEWFCVLRSWNENSCSNSRDKGEQFSLMLILSIIAIYWNQSNRTYWLCTQDLLVIFWVDKSDLSSNSQKEKKLFLQLLWST